MVFEWLVEAGDGGTCIVRLVNSGFGDGEEWDEQYHGMTEGWKFFLANLRLHLTHFRGRRAHAVNPHCNAPRTPPGGLDGALRGAGRRPRGRGG
ncbi:MAG: hypothetical protein ACR2JF_16135 [Iamia sp.]